MKFLCKTEFFHSGVRLYTVGTVYDDITPKVAEQLIALDKNIPLGALSFFTPVDEESVKFVKDRQGKQARPADGNENTTPAPKPPTRAELMAEAKNLGIKGTNTMKTEALKEAIDAAKNGQQPPQEGGDQGNTWEPQE
jgi:formylmethanofuran dehydrogenase subunit B